MSLDYGFCKKAKRPHEISDIGLKHKCKWCKEFIMPKRKDDK